MLTITSTIQIPPEEFTFTFARSGGPGGQNVNKVNSKAVLRWTVATSPSLPEDVRARFMDKFATRITTEGDLIITCQKYRDQTSNVDNCLEKLQHMLISVAVPPRLRRATRPTAASKERRVAVKREISQKKQSRSRPRVDE
jgi:ribosome-associated protein